MARNVLASLVVSLGLDAAEFASGLTKSEYQAKKFADSFNRSTGSIASGLKGLAAGVAAGFSVGAITSWTKEVIHAAENLKDLSVETGSTVESLSRLQNITTIGGGGIDEFNAAIERLSAGMNGSEELSTKTAAALQFLGISAKDPAQAMEEIALKLDKFADGTGKAAIARDLFGKSGVRFLATLHDIANAGDISATTSAKQAAEAERLAESWRKLSNQATTLRDLVLSALVPALANFIEQMVEGTKIAGSFGESLRLNFLGIRPFDTAAESLEGLRKGLADFQKSGGGPVGRAFTAIFGTSDFDAQVSDMKKRIEFAKLLQRQAIDTSENAANFDTRDIRARVKPKLKYVSGAGAGAAGPKDDPARKELEARLKTIQFVAEQEQQVLTSRQAFLDQYYSNDLISITEYYQKRADTAAEALAVRQKEIDDEIAAQRAYQATLRTQPNTRKEQADVEVNIIDLTRKRAQAEQEAGRASVLAWFDQIRAAKDYARAVTDVVAELTELRGDTVGAGVLRIDQQQEQLRKRFTAEGNTEGIRALDETKQRKTLLLELTKAQEDYGLVTESIGLAQSRVEMDRQAGVITELASLQQRSEINKAMIPILTQQADAYEAIARASGNPQALLQVQRMRQEIYQLSLQTDLLADKFNNVFSEGFSTFLQDLANGTKSFKDALKDFGKSITQQLNKIAADQVSQQLFGKEGPLSGIGKFFSSTFGTKGAGKDQGAAAADSATALLNMKSSTIAADSALFEFVAATNAATASLEALAASGGGAGGFSGFNPDGLSQGFKGFGLGDFNWADGFGGGFAKGGYPPMGKISRVGEAGPEWFVPKSPGLILPDSLLKALPRPQSSITTIVNIPPSASRKTAYQIAVQTERATRRASARNG